MVRRQTPCRGMRISVDDGGHVIVDCSKEFREAKWDDAASFVVIK